MARWGCGNRVQLAVFVAAGALVRIRAEACSPLGSSADKASGNPLIGKRLSRVGRLSSLANGGPGHLLFTYNSWRGVTRPDRPQLTRDQLFFDGSGRGLFRESSDRIRAPVSPTIMSNQTHGRSAKGRVLIYTTCAQIVAFFFFFFAGVQCYSVVLPLVFSLSFFFLFANLRCGLRFAKV